MAKEYGFEYELVEYKWPRWLHQQSEKQRIIWGYKILFLDVLFPLHVKKIIFVDADQVVRADMKELRDLDLGGAPYGYTPFCNSRREMDGFRYETLVHPHLFSNQQMLILVVKFSVFGTRDTGETTSREGDITSVLFTWSI